MENNFGSNCNPSDCATCGGCGGGTNERSTITITLEDDTEVECAILTTFPVANNRYIALLALDEEGQPVNGEVYLYTFEISESGDPVLSNIMSDEEYDKAAAAFNQIIQMAQLQDAVENIVED